MASMKKYDSKDELNTFNQNIIASLTKMAGSQKDDPFALIESDLDRTKEFAIDYIL
jgi:hypothetical protein